MLAPYMISHIQNCIIVVQYNGHWHVNAFTCPSSSSFDFEFLRQWTSDSVFNIPQEKEGIAGVIPQSLQLQAQLAISSLGLIMYMNLESNTAVLYKIYLIKRT